MTLLRCALALAVSMNVIACGDDEGECNGGDFGGGSLEGSYCSNKDVTWTEVATLIQNVGADQLFTVEYRTPREGGTFEKALAVSILIRRPPLPGERINFLAENLGRVWRQVDIRQDLDQWVDPSRATFTFTSGYAGTAGSPVAGEFAMVFADTSPEAGRTLSGSFEGTLVEVVFGPPGQ